MKITKTIILSLFFVCTINYLALAELRADINNDGKVNFIDYSILSEEWLMADYSLKFNGTDQYLTFPDNPVFDFGTVDFSIAFWINVSSLPELNKEVVLLEKYNSFSGMGFRIVLRNNPIGSPTEGHTLELGFWGNDGIVSKRYVHDFIEEKWYHLLISYTNRGDCVVYKNSFSLGSFGTIGVGSISAPASLVFGAADDEFEGHHRRHFNGKLDDIRIYKGKALSPQEVAEIYNGGSGLKLNGTEDGLSWGSNCDDGTGDALTDITGTVDGILYPNIGDSMWEAGGVPFIIEEDLSMEDIETIDSGSQPLSFVPYKTQSNKKYRPTYTMVTSYTDSAQIKNTNTTSDHVVISGIPLSSSYFYDPTINPSEKDTVGGYHALNIIEDTSESDEIDDSKLTPKHFNFYGNRVSVSKINNRITLKTINTGFTSIPKKPYMLNGIPMALGEYNELIFNKTDYTLNDVSKNPKTNKPDIKEIMWGGIPLIAGRIENEYYLILQKYSTIS